MSAHEFVRAIMIIGAVYLIPMSAVMGAYLGYKLASQLFGPIVVLTIREGVLYATAISDSKTRQLPDAEGGQ